MPRGELVIGRVFSDGAADLMDASVELVHHGEDIRFHGARLDGRAVIAGAVVGDDEVFDLRAQLRRKS